MGSAQFVGNPEHGQHIAEAVCAACHGADGNSAEVQYPKLAEQNPVYLYSQLQAFKTGARRSAIMSGIVAPLSEADLADAASFYSRQTIRPDPVRDRHLAAIGQHIFFAGANQVPPCAMCHGKHGSGGTPMMMGQMGMMAEVPSLNGQHAAYIIGQLNLFASGQRQGRMMGMMMGRIAAGLSERDKKAVAEYLSGLP